MVISEKTIKKIRDILEKNYSNLSIRLSGEGEKPSIMDLIYNYNFINNLQDNAERPKSLKEVKEQQEMPGVVPEGEAHEVARQHLSSNLEHWVKKHQQEVMSRIEAFIRDNNNDYKFNALQNLDRPEHLDTLVKQSTVGDLKRELRDYAKDANRNWTRIAVTETSNAIGLGSVDRLVSDNVNKDLNGVYVYRINPDDAATCKYCRAFYIDSDGSPKVYKLSTILSNGSNYGKKADAWKPVAQSTHPNCRDSQLVELKPGWRVLPGGKQTFIGLEAWQEYINEKVAV